MTFTQRAIQSRTGAVISVECESLGRTGRFFFHIIREAKLCTLRAVGQVRRGSQSRVYGPEPSKLSAAAQRVSEITDLRRGVDESQRAVDRGPTNPTLFDGARRAEAI